MAPAHRRNISHDLVEPTGRLRRGSNCSRDMLRRGRVLLQLGRRRRPSVTPVVAAAVVDLLAGGPQIDDQAMLPSVALLGLGSNGSPEHVQRAQRGGPQLWQGRQGRATRSRFSSRLPLQVTVTLNR